MENQYDDFVKVMQDITVNAGISLVNLAFDTIDCIVIILFSRKHILIYAPQFGNFYKTCSLAATLGEKRDFPS